MKHLTVRNISADLGRALEREVRHRGKSLNETVKELLSRALGLSADAPYDNGLGSLPTKVNFYTPNEYLKPRFCLAWLFSMRIQNGYQ